MKKLIASFCVAGLVAFTGCNSSPTGGRPGTGAAGTGGAVSRTGSSTKETFKLKGPTTSTKVEQGTAKTFSISISRGGDFKDDVTLKAESDDPKVHVTLEPNVFKGSEKKDVEATVKVDDDAKIGEHLITITGTPQAGESTTVQAKVDVAAKAKNK